MEYRVSEDEHGMSLLAFLSKKSDISLSSREIKLCIGNKQCLVGGRVEIFPSRKLMEGEKVRVEFSRPEKSLDNPLRILFEDSCFAVVNKSAHIVCEDSVFAALLKKKGWHLVHRLDKETSGAILLAKTEEALYAGKKLFTLFTPGAEKNIQKIYLTLVDGEVAEPSGKIENYLGEKNRYQGQTIYGFVEKKLGKKAITFWTKITNRKGSSFLCCDIETGRTHQIRVHLSEMGHPVLGDSQYARGSKVCKELSPQRQLLHAWKLLFKHPFTQKWIEVIAPIPPDFQEALQFLGMQVPQKEVFFR